MQNEITPISPQTVLSEHDHLVANHSLEEVVKVYRGFMEELASTISPEFFAPLWTAWQHERDKTLGLDKNYL